MMASIKLLVLYLTITQYLSNVIRCHVCDHKFPSVSELTVGIEQKSLPPNFRGKRSTSPNLRIYFDYQSSFTSYSYAGGLKTKIMEPAKNLLESVIMAKSPNTGLLLVDRSCTSSTIKMSSKNEKGCANGCAQTTCTDVIVPDVYLKACKTIDTSGNLQITGSDGAGIANVDIVLLVTYTSCSVGTLAYAASCFMESVLDRPILGVVNLCSNSINPNTNVQSNIQTVVHEIIHALGFGVDKYAFYRYSDGSPIVPRNAFGLPSLGVSSNGYYNWNDKIIKPITRQRKSVSSGYSITFYGFVLPNVVAAAQAHFDCPTLEAVDLEDYGGSGSALSHFDEYFLFNEMMTPQSNNGIEVLSRITLALLQDTGWYNVDYSKVGDLDYGYKKGCVLPENGCYSYMKWRESNSLSLDPFCNNALIYGNILDCSLFKNYFYKCGLSKYASVSPQLQYFTSLPGISASDVNLYAGLSPFNEYCPGYWVNGSPNFICSDVNNINANSIYNSIPSYFGADSMCVNTYMYNPTTSSIYGATCQKFSYNPTTNYSFYIGNSMFKCPSNAPQNYTASNGAMAYISCQPIYNQINNNPTITSSPSIASSSPTTKSSKKMTTKSSKKMNSITSETLICLVVFMIFKRI